LSSHQNRPFSTLEIHLFDFSTRGTRKLNTLWNKLNNLSLGKAKHQKMRFLPNHIGEWEGIIIS